jgi:hypothetical protein
MVFLLLNWPVNFGGAWQHRDDLVVGAPLFAPSGDYYETGRIYVYMMRDHLRPASPPTIGNKESKKSKERVVL